MRKVIVDVHGGDNPPSEIIKGAIDAVNEKEDLSIVLVGLENDLNESLKELTYPKDRVELVYATEVVTNYDSPTGVMKEKKDSSLIKAMNLLSQSDDIDGIVCCGNTGAVLASSMFILGRINRCRPTLATRLPNGKGGFTVIADCGANVDCKEEQLLGFAHMGIAYNKALGLSDNPKVALLSNGAEEKKGNELVKNTHILFKEQSFNFIGNVEGSNCLDGSCDVIVTDGFAGNVLLKNVEGTAKMLIKDMIKYARSLTDENEAKAVMKTVNYLMNKYDFNSQGGAVILGVNKIVVKGHGVANASTIKSTINDVCKLADNNLVEQIREALN